MKTIAIFQTQYEIGYANKPLWYRYMKEGRKDILAVLFLDCDEKYLDKIEELYRFSEEECARVLYDILTQNVRTFYMN